MRMHAVHIHPSLTHPTSSTHLSKGLDLDPSVLSAQPPRSGPLRPQQPLESPPHLTLSKRTDGCKDETSALAGRRTSDSDAKLRAESYEAEVSEGAAGASKKVRRKEGG